MRVSCVDSRSFIRQIIRISNYPASSGSGPQTGSLHCLLVQPTRKYSGWSLELSFNFLKLREALNTGVYGIFKIQDSNQLRKILQTARQRGGFQTTRQFRVSKTLIS